MEVPRVPVNFVPATAGETFMLGTLKIRIMEDGSHTDNRIGSAEITIPANTPGPIAHWHETHEGDYVTVPTRAVHTFSNPTTQPARFFNTYTPAFYINYFKLLSSLVQAGSPMTPEANRRAMAYFATIGVAEDVMKAPPETEKEIVKKDP